jgi:hypothetical protein
MDRLVVLHIEIDGKQGFFLARFSVLFLAPGFSRWGRPGKEDPSALQRGFSKRLQPSLRNAQRRAEKHAEARWGEETMKIDCSPTG